jgi:hypothetical protein
MRKFNRNVVLCLLGMVLGGSLAWAADAPTLRPDHPSRYTVQTGDTLWGISGRFLSEPWRWPQLWQANPQIKNPDLIYPGDELELVYVDGGPRLTKRSGRPSSRVVKLSPRLRVSEAPIPTIPMDAVGPFLTRPVVLSSEEDFDAAPYVLAFPEGHIRGGRGNHFYARNLPHPVGTRFDIVRKAGELRGGDNNELLGYGAGFVGTAVLVAPGDPATLEVDVARFDVRTGDRLVLASAEDVYQNFQPRAPAQPIYGSVIAMAGYSGGVVMQGGRFDIVILDRGTQDGLAPGDVLRIDRLGRIVRDQVPSFEGRANPIASSSSWGGLPQARDDSMHYLRPPADPAKEFHEMRVSGLGVGEPVKLPDERSGLAMVFRTFDRVSVALVMESTSPIHVGDRVRNP